jgi:hypothetical protein
MTVPIHNCGELSVYLDDTDGDIYLTVETNDHTKSGSGYSISMTELNRYLANFRTKDTKTS